MGDLFQLEEQEQSEIQVNQEEQIQQNQQLQEGNIVEEKQEQETDVLNQGFIMDTRKLKPKKGKNPKTKSKKKEEKKKAEEKYLDAIKFDKTYAEARGDDSNDMAAIRSAMSEYFNIEKTYEKDVKSEDSDVRDNAYEMLAEKLRDVEAKCNKYLRFKICFSKAARERTAQVRQLREEVQSRIAKYNVAPPQPVVKEESKAKKGFRRLGDGIKRFFTERVPDGFKGVGRSIKRSFNDTFKTRTAGQFFKDAARDYIWGGIFRNAFNILASLVFIPIWLGNEVVKGVGQTITKLSGGKYLADKTYPKIGIPVPHLPSTWTRHHEAMAAEKERQQKLKEQGKNTDGASTNSVYISDEAVESAMKFNIGFKLFGPSAFGGKLNKKGTALVKTGVGYTNKQTRDSIIERANKEYQSAEKWREDNVDDDEDDDE